MGWILKLLILLVVAAIALQIFARWPRDFSGGHSAVETPAPGDGLWVEGSGARVSVTVAGPPAKVLADVGAAMLALPRTTLVAGSPDEGRATYVTRSALWGFPDLTTIEAQPEGYGTRLEVWGRLQMGKYDLGVNRDRILGVLAEVAPGVADL